MTTTTKTSAWSHFPDLAGATILVAGGSGGVGEGVVRALIDAGTTVIATGRNQPRLHELAERISSERLSTLALDGLDPEIDDTLDDLVNRTGKLDGVVVSIASRANLKPKPLLSLSDADWKKQRILPDLTSIFRIYRASVPRLKCSGALVLLNGYSAEIPFPGNAGTALAAAAAKSMTSSLAAELASSGPRVYDVILGVVRTRARQLAGIDDPRWLDAADIGRHVAELIAGSSPLAGVDLHYFLDKSLGPQPLPAPK